MAELRNATGRAIRVARERAGLRQEDLAARTGVAQSHLSGIERGIADPSIGVLSRLAEGLGLTLSQLTQEIEAERLRLSRRPAED